MLVSKEAVLTELVLFIHNLCTVTAAITGKLSAYLAVEGFAVCRECRVKCSLAELVEAQGNRDQFTDSAGDTETFSLGNPDYLCIHFFVNVALNSAEAGFRFRFEYRGLGCGWHKGSGIHIR